MESFNQLFNRYTQRLGISDSELARAVGVSRQTIFRWREGSTARPRHRQDVLSIAQKLRLTPEERDTLLLSAGFAPEAMPPVDESINIAAGGQGSSSSTGSGTGAEELIETEPNPKPKIAIGHFVQNQKWLGGGVVIVALLLVVGMGSWWAAGGFATPTPTRAGIAPAASGETLVLVTHFANYASQQTGYNVAGRLAEALTEEIERAQLADARVAIWPEPVAESGPALQAGRAVSATLVIYGEYDAGRVVVKMASPANQNSFTDPAVQRHVANLQELAAIINSDLPQQIRSPALIALGQISLGENNLDRAKTLLLQARNNLQNNPPVDSQTVGLVNFYLGVAYQHSNPPNLDAAIEAYSQALENWPSMISSLLNRAAAYEARKLPGDLERARRDAERVVEIAPDWASGYNNRASILMNLGGESNLKQALADLDTALLLKPDFPEAYLNKAFIFVRQGQSTAQVTPLLEKALELRPGYGTALNSLCWGYALEQQPEAAMPYCQQAVQAEPRPLFYDSRGLAYALLNNYPAAIEDFERYIDWLEAQPGDTWQIELTRRREWVAALAVGENPFTPELLAELRREFGQ